jgi:hypothetical protein
MFLILLIYGYVAITFSYLFSLFVETVAGGFSFVTIIHIVTGILSSTASAKLNRKRAASLLN